MILVLATAISCAGNIGSTGKPASVGSSFLPFSYQVPQLEKAPEGVRHFFLDNGLEVLTIRNSSSPMICLNLTIRTGAAYEDYYTSGMTHMLEHLLFNGTVNRTQEELYEETDLYGIYSNAFTRKFYTNFFMLLPSEFMENGMDIQSDMIFNSTLPPEKLEKERGIVIEELRKDKDSDMYDVQNFFNRMNYGGSSIGMPTLGTMTTIENMSREDIYDFYKSHYISNNIILTVIGNFDEQTLKASLEQFYGVHAPMPIPDAKSARALPRGPAGFNSFNQTTLTVSQTRAQYFYQLPGGLNFHNSDGSIPQQRELSAFRKLSYEALVHFLGEELSQQLPDLNPSVLFNDYPYLETLQIEFAIPSDQDVQTAAEQVNNSVENFINNLEGIMTPEKMRLWTKQKVVENISLLDSPHYYSMMQSQDLVLGGDFVIAKMQALEKFSDTFSTSWFNHFYLQPDQLNVVYKQALGTASDEQSEVSYGKSVLPSGATLVTATSSGSDMFGMHVLIKNRSAIEGEYAGGAEILHSLLDSGTDLYSGDEIQDQLAGIGAQTKFIDMSFIPYDDYYNSAEWGYIRFECLNEDAETGIQLLTHMMSNTVLDEGKVEEGLSGANMRLMMKKSSGSQTASNEFGKLFLGEDHPSTKSISGTPSSLAMINLSVLQDLQKNYFRPENYIITISSSLPHIQLETLFNRIWMNTGSPAARAEIVLPSANEKQEKKIELGKEQANIRLGYKFDINPDDKAAVSLMTDLLSYRMMFDLRETQGLAYSLGISDGSYKDKGWMIASIGTGAENADHVISEMKAYFNPDKLADVDANEIRKTVNSNKGRYMMRNLTRIGQAFYMGYYEFLTGDYETAVKRGYEYDAITPEDIRQVAEKYLYLPENYTLLIVN